MNVLLVEDDDTIRHLMRVLIEHEGHTVVEADTGTKGWLYFQQYVFQMVITDGVLPGMDGLTLVRKIRATTLPHYVYIMMISARHGRTEVVDGLEAGGDDYVVKPFDPREVRARIAIGARVIAMEQALRAAYDRVALLATQDHLTGLLNRQALTDHILGYLEQALQAHSPIAFILLDIDHFKLINDRYGHLVGDQALRLVAETLQSTVAGRGLVGRWGGEEFLVVLPQTDITSAAHVAEQLRSRVAALIIRGEHRAAFSLSISLGVASQPTNAPVRPLAAYLKAADDGLYRAKAAGRNRVVCVDLADSRQGLVSLATL